MAEPSGPSLMRSLGAFVGHVAKAVREPVAAPTQAPAHANVRTCTAEQSVAGPEGTIVLRRTVIEEVEIKPGEVSDEQHRRERSSDCP